MYKIPLYCTTIENISWFNLQNLHKLNKNIKKQTHFNHVFISYVLEVEFKKSFWIYVRWHLAWLVYTDFPGELNAPLH